MESFFSAISENLQYATIAGAVITALGAIIAAIITREKRKEKEVPPVSQESKEASPAPQEPKEKVIIPPPIDPLSHLQNNLGGIKDIDKMNLNSEKYYQTLAARIAIQKSDNTIVKISRRDKHEL